MNAGAPLPAPVLIALTAGVLAAHLWALRSAPARVRQIAPPRPAAFATRRIEVAAAAQPFAPSAAPSAPPPHANPAPRLQPASTPRTRRLQLPAPVSRATATGRHEPAAAALPDPVVPPVRIAPPTRLRYAVTAQRSGQLVQGRGELLWQRDGGTYEAELVVDLPGQPSRRQHSAGQLGPAGVEPRRFSEQLRGEQAAHFERELGRVSFSNNRPAAPLSAGAQDRLTVLLHLGALMAGAPGRFAPGASIAIQTATTREAPLWVFTVSGDETLPLPGGALPTVKLVRPPGGEFDQLIEVWLAPGAAYAPVRLRLTQPNGDWVDHQWSATDRP